MIYLIKDLNILQEINITTSGLVDDNLRIIVLIVKEILFLKVHLFHNGFEKFVISYDFLLNQKEKDEAKKFFEIINKKLIVEKIF